MTINVGFGYWLKRFLYGHFFSVIGICLLAWVAWSFFNVNSFFYKRIFGRYTGQSYPVWSNPSILDIEDKNINQVYNINGYRIQKVLRKKFALSGISVYNDDNTTFWKWYFHQSGNEQGRIYNKIAAFDLSIAHGRTADESNLKKIKFSHELNGLMTECVGLDCYLSNAEINNYHIIPKSTAIKYGMKALSEKKHTPVYIEGYLMDWQSLDYPSLKMETAIVPGQISKQKVAGRTTDLCFQLYLTKLVYDGYVFE